MVIFVTPRIALVIHIKKDVQYKHFVFIYPNCLKSSAPPQNLSPLHFFFKKVASKFGDVVFVSIFSSYIY